MLNDKVIATIYLFIAAFICGAQVGFILRWIKVSHNGFRAGSIPAVGARLTESGWPTIEMRMEMSNLTVNDFESDLYELNKLVENIFQALESISLQGVFSFTGTALTHPPLVIEPEIEWFIPLYPEESSNE